MISVLDKRSQRRMREIDLERAKEAQERREDQKRTVSSPKYPQRAGNALESFLRTKQGVAAIALYSFLAEHIDPTCGAVVAEQQFWLTN